MSVSYLFYEVTEGGHSSGANLSELANFGGFVYAWSLVKSGVLNRAVDFTLVVDGLLASSQSVPYTPAN